MRRLAVLLLAAALAAVIPAHAEGEPWERAQRLLERVARGGPPLTDEEVEFILRHGPADAVEVRLMTLSAVVFDDAGRPVRGLGAEDFRVLEEGSPRPVVWVNEEPGASFRLAVLVDVSTSMRADRRRQQIRRTLLPLMREVRRSDRLKLLSFSGPEVETHTGWVRWPMTVLERAASLRGTGETALLDALAGAARRLPRLSAERHAIVLVTDAIDNASRLGPEEVVRAARSVAAPVYVLALGGAARRIQLERGKAEGVERLRVIARQTGGRLFLVPGQEGEAADRAAGRIVRDLRHQYLLGFEPASGVPEGRIQTLEVRVPHRQANVLARKGYRR